MPQQTSSPVPRDDGPPMTFDPPNLDCLTVDPNELRAFSDVLMNLALYAELKANAMTFRAKGNIPAALKAERNLDNIYNQLPVWARW